MSEKHWYVAYTKYKKEREFSQAMAQKKLESYFPTDANGQPLFSCYVFVNLAASHLHLVRYLRGFSHLVSFGEEVAQVSSSQIETMKRLTEFSQSLATKSSRLIRGDEVRIIRGPLRGTVGKLVRDQGKSKLALEVPQLNQCILVSVPLEHVVPVGVNA